VLGEIGAALQFRQDQQNADQPAKPVTVGNSVSI